jgi:nitrate/nitrite transporter NarK
MLLALSSSPVVLVISLAMLALGMSSETVMPPLLTRSVFGRENYAVIYGRVSMAYNFGAAFASPIWGAVYDGAGSYLPGLWLSPVVLIVNLGLMIWLIKKNRNE